MSFKIDNRTFEIVVASDVNTRDGLGIELWDNDKDEMVLEIFRHDDKKKITFFSTRNEVPLELLDRFLKEFEETIGRTFQDDDIM